MFQKKSSQRAAPNVKNSPVSGAELVPWLPSLTMTAGAQAGLATPSPRPASAAA